jgi:hypothetical protein
MSRPNTNNLTNEQRRLINIYVTQYNQTSAQIDRLLDTLDDIRENMQYIINSRPNSSNHIRNNNNNRYSNGGVNHLLNNLFLDDYQSNYVYYDYSRPINPLLYTNANANATTTNRTTTNNSSYTNNRQSRNTAHNTYLSNLLSTFLNTNVDVRPTELQIRNASRLIRYCDIDNPLSETCPISLERFSQNEIVSQLLPCGHIFARSQIQEWFERNVRCPVCRYDIRNYVRPTNNNASSAQNQTQNQTQTTNTSTPIVEDVESDSDNSSIEQTYTDINVNTNASTNASTNTSTNASTNASTNFSNINVTRDSFTNEINQFTFDISNNEMVDNILDDVAGRLFQNLFLDTTNNTNTMNTSRNNNDRFVFDPSNNILIYETILRPNNRQQ